MSSAVHVGRNRVLLEWGGGGAREGGGGGLSLTTMLSLGKGQWHADNAQPAMHVLTALQPNNMHMHMLLQTCAGACKARLTKLLHQQQKVGLSKLDPQHCLQAIQQ